jgi:hypothetical protein
VNVFLLFSEKLLNPLAIYMNLGVSKNHHNKYR